MTSNVRVRWSDGPTQTWSSDVDHPRKGFHRPIHFADFAGVPKSRLKGLLRRNGTTTRILGDWYHAALGPRELTDFAMSQGWIVEEEGADARNVHPFSWWNHVELRREHGSHIPHSENMIAPFWTYCSTHSNLTCVGGVFGKFSLGPCKEVDTCFLFAFINVVFPRHVIDSHRKKIR